jgi:glutamate decarboxylase
MERETEALMVESLNKNLSDADEYPVMMGMRSRCVSVIAHLWGAEQGEAASGSARAGSL